MRPRFLSQKMAQKEPEKKMPCFVKWVSEVDAGFEGEGGGEWKKKRQKT